jgi:hypothetical protein
MIGKSKSKCKACRKDASEDIDDGATYAPMIDEDDAFADHAVLLHDELVESLRTVVEMAQDVEWSHH